jgi:hypothetical protein
VQIGPARDIEFVALFRTTLEDAATTDLGTGGRELTWWVLGSHLAALSPIDAHLAELSVTDH